VAALLAPFRCAAVGITGGYAEGVGRGAFAIILARIGSTAVGITDELALAVFRGAAGQTLARFRCATVCVTGGDAPAILRGAKAVRLAERYNGLDVENFLGAIVRSDSRRRTSTADLAETLSPAPTAPTTNPKPALFRYTQTRHAVQQPCDHALLLNRSPCSDELSL
jgi:hypothetical protein